MPNISVISLQALESIPADSSREDRLHIGLKILRTLEDAPDNCTHRLSTALRAVLQRVLAEPEGDPDQKKVTIDALQRLKRIDPRVVKRKAAKEAAATSARPGRATFDPEAWKEQLEKTPADPEYGHKLLQELKARS